MKIRLAFFLSLLVVVLFALSATAEEIFSLPANTRIIEEEAFSGVVSIRTLSLPEGVECIESRAFSDCEIEEVILPSSLTYIAEDAFEKSIHATVAGGSYAYEWCIENNIDFAVIPIETPAECFMHTPIDATHTRITGFSGEIDMISIPSKLDGYIVTELADNLFSGCESLTYVQLPDSLTSIGAYAFNGCTNLKTSVFPKGLETIEYRAFYDCESISVVTFPTSVTTIGGEAFASCGKLHTVNLSTNWNATWTENYGGGSSPFTDDPMLTSIVIPEGMTAVPDYAFRGCVSLTSVTLPDSLKMIGDNAFYGCTSLENVAFPDSLKTIEGYAFNGCAGLETLVFPQSLEVIEYRAFYDCESISVVTFPTSVTTIGGEAFASCGKLHTVNLSTNWNATWTENYGGGSSPFTDDPMLTSIVIPEGMTAVPDYAFYGCTSLIAVELPDSLKTIGIYAFNNCTNLPYVYVSPIVKEIGACAFDNCNALTIESEYGAKAISYAKENGISYYYLSLTAASKPMGRLYRGDIFTVKGYVRSNYPLTRVVSTIYNADKTEILYQVDLAPENETDFNLNSYLNSEMHFSALALGSYCFELKASTERSEEMFLDTTFTIVPPPLRVTLSNEDSPSGLQSIGSAVSIGGIVRSNYLITSVTIEIRKDSDNTLVTGKTVSPNTYTYNVSSLAASMDTASLKTGDYVYILRIVSNNQTRRMAYSEFSMRAYDAEVPEDTYNAVYNFVTTNDSQTFWKFIGTHMMKKYCEVDSASNYLLLSWSKYHEAVNSYFKNYFAADQGAEFRKNLYKEQLLKIIQSSADTASPSGSIIKNMELIRSSLLKYGKIEATYILENGGQLSEAMKEYIKTYNKCLDHMGKTIDAFKFADDVVGIITEQAGNYEAEMDFLDGLADSFANSSNDEKELYLIALEEIEAEYQSRTYKVLSKIYDKMTSEMVKMGTSVVTSFIFKAVGGTGIAYSVTTLAVDLLAELTGANEAADELVEFITLCECAMAANNTYSDAHTAVVAAIANETAPTPEQINKLLTSFDVAKKCTLRLINHMIKNADSSAESNVYLQEMSRINKVTILGD